MKRSRKYPVHAGDWYKFHWADEHVNPEGYREGFCRNRLLLFVRVIANGLLSVAHYHPCRPPVTACEIRDRSLRLLSRSRNRRRTILVISPFRS